MEKIIALLDSNNFYASCERVFNPGLEGKPIVILSNNDGCIIARSNEAKALGIPMGEPYFKARHIIETNDVKVFSSNYTLYGDMSARVMMILASMVKDVEIYSIDEAFFDLTHHLEPEKLALKIRKAVKQATGIPVSIGIGSSKTLAKTANKVAKKYKTYEGVFYINSIERREKVLRATEIGEVWGIGRQLTKKLKSNGINTAYDLSIQQDSWIRKNMTVCGLRTAQELRGIPCINMEEQPQARKSIIVSRSFGQRIFDKNSVREALANFAERASEKLRSQGLLASKIQIFLNGELSASGTGNPSESVMVVPEYPTDNTGEIINLAGKGFDCLFSQDIGYKKCGLILLGLIEKKAYAKDLFDSRDLTRLDALMKTIDTVNKQFGSGTLSSASAKGKGRWIARKDSKSLCYTTRWNELPVVL